MRDLTRLLTGLGSKARITVPQHCCPLSPSISRSRQNGLNATLCAKTGREQMQQMNVGQYGYSITSSASSCIVFGMVNPSAFAVF